MLRAELARLLVQGRAADAVVGRRAGAAPVRWAAWQLEAARWQAAFAADPAARFALWLDTDTLSFAAALFGAWHAGKTIVLPGDALPATVAHLQSQGLRLAGAVPGGLQAAAETTHKWQPLDPQAVQLVVHTSGSTGAPAALPKRLDQLFSEVDALESAFGGRIGAAEVLATVSHQHVYGLLFRVLWPLAAGRVIHAQRIEHLESLDDELREAGLLVSSPAHLKRLPPLRPDARLRAVFSSGGPLPDAAVPESLERLGHAPIEVFGSSETGGIAWRQGEHAAAHWQALPGVQWRIEDQRLQVQSAHLDQAGWQATLDRAEPIDGGFTLLGRADRILKIEEKRVSLAAIEQILMGSACFDDLRVFALPAAGLAREQLAVVAQPNEAAWQCIDAEGKKAFVEQLRSLLRPSLDAPSLPRRWRFVSQLPANAQSKVTQAALLALFDPRRPQPRVTSRTPERAELRFTIEPGLPQLRGHFPEAPIVPGVAQLEWAVLYGRELFAPAASFKGAEALKFQRVIAPGSVLTLTLDWRADAGRLGFSYDSASGRHASGRVLFETAASSC